MTDDFDRIVKRLCAIEDARAAIAKLDAENISDFSESESVRIYLEREMTSLANKIDTLIDDQPAKTQPPAAPVMTPAEFRSRMTVCANDGDHEMADRLMCDILDQVGYGEGVSIFHRMLKRYV